MTILECQVRIYTFVYPNRVAWVLFALIMSVIWESYQKHELITLRQHLDLSLFTFVGSCCSYCVVLCLFSFCGWCPMSHVSLHCPFLIARSIYSNVLFRHITAVSFISGGNQRTLDRQRTISFHNISNTYRKKIQ